MGLEGLVEQRFAALDMAAPAAPEAAPAPTTELMTRVAAAIASAKVAALGLGISVEA